MDIGSAVACWMAPRTKGADPTGMKPGTICLGEVCKLKIIIFYSKF